MRCDISPAVLYDAKDDDDTVCAVTSVTVDVMEMERIEAEGDS